MEIRSYTWPLGNSPVSCKMVGSLQAVSIFVSTLSITAIALDRYQLLVYPTKKSFQLTGALLALGGIWILGVVLALPLFIVRTLQHHEIPIPNSPISSVDYCLEEWPNERGRSLYSIGSILIQYALPIITVSVAHARICNKLQVRMASMNHQQATRQQQQKQPPQPPLNNAPGPSTSNGHPLQNSATMLIVYAVCHMVGMSLACANPLLYGWLNDNFRKEFQKIGTSFVARSNNNRATTQSMRQRAKMVVQQQTATDKRPNSKAVGLHKHSTALSKKRCVEKGKHDHALKIF
ncbi:hypothetical protein DAPPUDRAFT_330424 [Daphnia pulex]|uniref:G-protein coupled receptors family 1 profile domain-containing protein n=1 Tax=Daphnia pulex TaxID=6669 RepID=E9HJJ0_DAPPU|nr:hypothetical protein DAPPUDRAFT_330424 [Daphnia pulex]|eukprot:EFX68123.1 hypothetical protein DAPPUDRAFT_330424 [Daphnia pulex]